MVTTQLRPAARGAAGFALIELLVVIAILALLAGLAVLGIGSIQHNADVTACRTEGAIVAKAIEAARLTNVRQEYPGVEGPDGLDAVRTAGLLDWGDPSRFWRYDSPASPAGLSDTDLIRVGTDRVDESDCSR